MNRAIHSDHIDRWLGAERAEAFSRQFRGWYGPPIKILDMPGNVFVNGDGDFSGDFERGVFYSAMDSLESHVRRFNRRLSQTMDRNTLHAGFASLDAVIAAASTGKRVLPAGGLITKTGTAPGATGGAVDLWYVGAQPAAGTVGSAAPGGLIPTSTTGGAMAFPNPTGGEYTLLSGADFMATVANMGLLLYDRIFSVTKTMNAITTEAVTGVPTRYQSTTATAADYIGGNFLFISCRTVLANTGHNWTVCQYTDQSGTGTSTLPSVTGIAQCAANRLDMPTGSWFCPLESGDVGIKALTQMQCSAAVATGAIDFNIGHPLGFMSFPIANQFFPWDWMTNRDLMPRIFDNAALALMHLPVSANTATTFTGTIYTVQG